LRPLDGIFVRGDVRATTCAPRRTVLTRAASDHLPLIAELEVGMTDEMARVDGG
jgi:endonuclease/exonuclease/phosphatase family metal-dependent hydrolase